MSAPEPVGVELTEAEWQEVLRRCPACGGLGCVGCEDVLATVERIIAARESGLRGQLADVVRARNHAMRQRDEERKAKEGNIAALNEALTERDELAARQAPTVLDREAVARAALEAREGEYTEEEWSAIKGVVLEGWLGLLADAVLALPGVTQAPTVAFDVEAVRILLADHDGTWELGHEDSETIACGCGEYFADWDDHLHHQARAVVAADPRHTEAEVKAEALREYADTLGVDVGDEDGEWYRGYRQAQREALRNATAYADRIGGK